MKPDAKPATAKARAMLAKLQALAERGIDGEKLAARRKIDRLKARFNFDSPDAAEIPDLFHGTFKRSLKARRIYSFKHGEFEIANSAKWAIESATGIHCIHRDRDLLAEAEPATANRLARIAEHISESFRALVAQFGMVSGVSAADRGVFIMGLYDGMMNESRNAGQPLPSRPGARRRGRVGKPSGSPATGLHIHPYTLALGLGRQIRFSVPLEAIAAELDGLTQRRLAGETAPADPQTSARNGGIKGTRPAGAGGFSVAQT